MSGALHRRLQSSLVLLLALGACWRMRRLIEKKKIQLGNVITKKQWINQSDAGRLANYKTL